jgi:glucose-1-phosphate cytidylyltransferase
MKVVLLAGGFGTRLSEYTKDIPKPMVKINKKPIILYIMEHFAKYGHKDFYIALGYKGNVIKNYFSKKILDWNINLIDTGKNTMTGGRLKRVGELIKDETFFMTYGDGLSNVDLNKLLKFHLKKKKLVSLTAVRPPARFGALQINNGVVSYFKEKSKSDENWINGGFFVIQRKFLNFLVNDKTILERKPLAKAAKLKQLAAFKHEGFWQCMDTPKDKDILTKILKKKSFV